MTYRRKRSVFYNVLQYAVEPVLREYCRGSLCRNFDRPPHGMSGTGRRQTGWQSVSRGAAQSVTIQR
jgi:hypothetical protein